MRDCVFRENVAIGSHVYGTGCGGGSWIWNPPAATVEACTFVRNTAVAGTHEITGGGGGLFVDGYPLEGNNAHGTWIRTGRTEILLVGLGFVFDSADGAHTYTWKMRAPIEFDDEFQTAHSDFDAVMYLAEQDPLDPDEEPILEWTGFVTMRRINVE